MKLTLLALALLLPSSAWALCDDWTPLNTAMEATFVTLVVADWGQTKEFVAKGYAEQNPFLGSHPSQQRIDTLIPLAIAGQVALACWLPAPWRDFLQALSIAVESTAVRGNLSLGFAGRF
jgi:hypothetical protein